ncbi:non-ribosomal peptide synthetase, partial [Flavobacterium sp. WG21]|uniref:non-ribosomal peptide synthetase n=1 Tax=Flavobacterium sp. WG21 TaxID=1229487 RepID=UPI0003775698
MNVNKLIVELSKLSIHLSILDNQLEINAPKGVLNEDIIKNLKKYKNEIINFLIENEKKHDYALIPLSENKTYYKLSNTQKRFWLLTQVEDRSRSYNEFEAYTISGSLDVDIFEFAINQLLERHEILRTNFVSVNEEIMQVVRPVEEIFFKLERFDLTDSIDWKEKLEVIAQKLMNSVFDLTKSSLFKASIVQTAKDQYIFLFSLHHIITDGWSAKILIKELSDLYISNLTGKSNSLNSLAIQYKDYAEWQVNQITNDDNIATRNYWLQSMSGELPVLDLPTVNPRPAIKTFNGAVYNSEFEKSFTSKLKLFSKTHEVTNYTTLVAIVNVLLHKYTSQTDLIIGTTVSGRDHFQLEDMLGCFLNTLVLRNKINPNNSFVDLLATVKDNVFDALKHQHYPFDILLEELDVKTDLSRSAVFDVLIELHNYEKEAESFKDFAGGMDFRVEPYIFEKNTSQLDITFSFYDLGDDEMGVTIYYNTDLFSRTYIANLIAHFKKLTEQLLDLPSHNISEHSILLKKEEDLIKDFNQTYKELPKGTFMDIVDNQALSYENKIAISLDTERKSYGEVIRESNQLGNYLVESGLKHSEPVLFISERSIEMLIGMLGIMKAGGVYVPLAPDYPIGRITGIIKDCQATKILVSSEVLSLSFLKEIASETIVTQIISMNFLSERDEFNEEFQTLRFYAELAAKKISKHSLEKVRLLPLRYKDQIVLPEALWSKISHLSDYLSNLSDIKEASVGLCFENPIYGTIAIMCLQMLDLDFTLLDTEASRKSKKELLVNHSISYLLTESVFFTDFDEIYWELEGKLELIVLDSLIRISSDSSKETNFRSIWDYQAEITTEAINDYGWKSSYTNEAFSEKEMQEYIDNFSSKLSPYLSDSTKILEIGCGHGLVLFNLVHKVGYYLATDLSPIILDKNSIRLKRENITHVESMAIAAREIDQIQKSNYFDVIVCSSVVHYFPDTHYLEEVISKALSLIADGGIIYLDDLMDLNKKSELEESAVSYNRSNPEATAKVNWDNDLFVSKSFFDHIQQVYPEIESIECSPKLGSIENELTRYRYDAVLKVNKTRHKNKSVYTNNRHFSIGLDQINFTSALENLPSWITVDIEEFALQNIVDLKAIENKIDTKPAIEVKESDLAYIIYTSGSTGTPKGVMVEHLGMLNHLCAKVNDLELDANSVLVQNASQTFDISIWQFLSALMVGGKTVVYNQSLVLSPEKFIERVKEDGVTILEVVPSYLTVMMDLYEEIKVSYPSLRYLVVTGETLKRALVDRWFSLYPGIRMVNAYGPTEASDDITHHIMDKAPDNGIIPIGKAVQNFQIYILDDHQHLCPIGVKGELYVSGIGVGRGYLNNEAQTLKSFSQDPFISENNVRMYRTGDLARYLPDGTLEFFGRKDSQVKVRGYRIELEEIEQQLALLEGVSDSVVILKKDNRDENYLSGYVTVSAEKGTEISTEQLREELKLVLPSYMIPDYLSILPKMPTTGNGKIDRKALQQKRDGKVAISYLKPNTEVELTLYNLWKQLLDADEISIDDNFFELGGHSLLATRLVLRVQNFFSIKLELRDIFENPTIESLAKIVLSRSQVVFNQISLAPKNIDYPLSHGQKRLWILSQLGDGVAYNITETYNIKGELCLEALNIAMQSLIVRHEILRTTFREELTTNEIVQVIHTPEEFDFAIDTIYLDKKAESQLKKIFLSEAEYIFDLETGPLLRLKVIHLNNEEHILIFTLHHIISDGWSMEILFNEFHQLYSSYVEAREIELPPLKLQYKDYAFWQNNQNDNTFIQSGKSYWINEFSKDIPILSLPYKSKRPAIKTFNGAWERVIINKDISNSLKELSRMHHSSLFMTLFGSINVFLYLHSNQSNIVVGTPIAGRSDNELENQVGLYINTLAIRTEIDGSKSFADLLKQTKQKLLDAYQYQYYPFDLLVEQLDLSRDLSRSPLFDVMVILQNTAVNEKSIINETIHISEVEPIKTFSKYDLTFNFHESEDEIVLHVDYNTDLFSSDIIKTFLDRYLRIVAFISDQSECRIDNIEYLDKIDKDKLLKSSYKTLLYPKESDVIGLFTSTVDKCADKVALAYNGETWSYKDLDILSNRLGWRLKNDFNVGQGDIIGLLIPRSSSFVIGMLGILKTGAAYLPIPYDIPFESLKTIVKESGIKYLIGDSILYDFDEIENLNKIDINVILNAVETNNQRLPGVNSVQDHAYVIYTSGSSGKPKGVVVNHLSLLNYCNWFISNYNIDKNDKTLLLSSPAFDLCYTSLWGSLLSGAELHIMEEFDFMDSDKLNQCLIKNNITYIKITPSHMHMLIADPKYSLYVKQYALRLIVCGGEIINTNHLTTLLRDRPDLKIVNHYGPTETTIGVIVKDITKNNIDQFKANPVIGQPIDNIRAYILNSNGYLLAEKVVGQICIGGLGLSAGYLKRDDLTDEKFIANRFEENEKIYLTGDLGYWNDQGDICIVGRNDDQVKIRGYRVEPKEVARAIEAIECVSKAFVQPEMNVNGMIELIGYYTTDSDIESEELKEVLKEKLLPYMIPEILVNIDKFPITKNGKIDSKKLNLLKKDSSLTKELKKPSTAEEEGLLKLWQDVLGIQAISTVDNFFSLGGHSLKATILLSKIKKQFKSEITLKDIFQYPTIEKLSVVVKNTQGYFNDSITKANHSDYYAMSNGQNRLWVLNQLDDIGTAYNIMKVLEFEGVIDKTLLINCINAIVERHEILRTTIYELEGQPYQKINSVNELEFKVDCLDFENIDEQDVLVQELIKAEHDFLFDLSKGPLIRVKLLTFKDDKTLLIINMHHIISDGWSAGILMNELKDRYNNPVLNTEGVLESLPIQYKDYAEWQQSQIRDGKWEKDKQFWLQYLADDLPLIKIPSDYPRPQFKSYKGDEISFVISGKSLLQLKQLIRVHDSNMFILLLSLVKTFLYRYTGQKDIIVGIPITGRHHEELIGQVGFYLNMLAIRSKIQGAESFSDIVEQVKTNVLNGYEHQLYPFDMLVEDLDISRDLSRSPIFDVLVSYENEDGIYELFADDILLKSQNSGSKISKYDLSFYFVESSEGVNVTLEYSSDLFTGSTIERIKGYFMNLADALVSGHADVCLDDLEYLLVTEKERLVDVFNRTEMPFNREMSLSGLFAIQADRYGSRPAISYKGTSVSYASLKQGADSVSYQLQRDYGVCEGAFVGVVMQRSPELLMCLLGIMQLGACYVPIDPDFPSDRISYILADSGVSCVLVSDLYESILKEVNTKKIVSSMLFDKKVDFPSDYVLPTLYSDALMYMIYTSGSTGLPKGVEVSHVSVVNLLESMKNILNVANETRFLAHTTISFDISVLELFLPLYVGGCVVLACDESVKSPVMLIDLIGKENITVLQATPNMWRLLLDCGWSGQSGLKMLSGGEELDYALGVRLLSLEGELWNVYGPTETTIWSTAKRVDTASDLGSIGVPLGNTEVYVLDQSFHLVGIGVPGELYIGGLGVSRY